MSSWGRNGGGQYGRDSGPGNGTGDNYLMPYGHNWRDWQVNDTAYIVATCYLTFLCTFAVVMCFRSPTRLRIYATTATYAGFSIAVVGLIQAKGVISPNWFWAWNFLGEGLAVVALCLAIINVASGFYIMEGRRNRYWKISMCVIFVYGLIAAGTVGDYVYVKIINRTISATELYDIRQEVITENNWNATLYYIKVAAIDAREGRNSTLSGLPNWKELSEPETVIFARPSAITYLTHQLFMLLACFWSCLYLFVPLLKHHRRTRSVVERPVDSDMVAIGVWYISTVCILATLYFAINLVYVARPDLIYLPTMQAFDLCLRITIGPILFTPAPKRLIKFYRERLRSRREDSSTGRNGSHNDGPFRSAERNQNKGSGNEWRFANFVSPESTRVGSGNDKYGSAPRDSIDLSSDKTQCNFQEPTSPIGAFSRVKLFQSRDRGCSVESSRVLNKDFDAASTHSRYVSEERSDPSYSDIEMNQHSLQVSGDFKDVKLRDITRNVNQSIAINEPQQPKPVITAQQVRSTNGSASPILHTRNSIDKKDISNHLPAGTNDYSTTVESSITIDPLSAIDTPIEQLTGLQRQLAEHRSALLPQAIAFRAYHEELAASEPFDPNIREPPESSNLSRSASEARPSMSYVRRHPNENSPAVNNSTANKAGWSSFESKSKSSSHRTPPESPNAALSFSDSYNVSPKSKPRELKPKDALMAAFSKALANNSNSNTSAFNDVQLESTQGSAIATIEELAQSSLMNEQCKDKTSAFCYNDPYDDHSSFKRAAGSSNATSAPRLSSSKSRDSLPAQKGSKVKTRSKSDAAQKSVEKEAAIPLSNAKGSLPPPPRQSWQRSKSSKSSIPTLGSLETSHVSDESVSKSESNSSSSSFSTSPKYSGFEDYQAKPASQTFLPQSSPIVGYRGASLEYSDSRMSRERERATPLSPTLTGLNSRLDFSRNQRSIDNLSYYSKRTAELNNSGKTSAQSPKRQPRDLYPSPHYDPNERNTPSPTFYGRGGSSPSMAAAESFQNGFFSDLPTSTGSNSYSQNQLLAEDPWTQAMVSRAQARFNTDGASLERSGSVKDRSTNHTAN